MAIKTSYRVGPLLWNGVFALFCLGGGIWGAYDYWVGIPAKEQAFADFDEATRQIKELTEKGQGNAASSATSPPVAPVTPGAPGNPASVEQLSRLSADELQRYQAAKRTVERLTVENGGNVPVKPAAYDRPLQLWLWVVGCGVLGTPFFIWPMIRMMSRTWTLDDNRTLHTPEGTWTAEQIVDIDMSRWCSPTGNKRSTWKAWLKTADGKRLELDDHDYQSMDLIIGAYAHHFYPEQWTEKGRRVGEKSEESPASPDTEDTQAATSA